MSDYIQLREDYQYPDTESGHCIETYTFADTEAGHDLMQWITWAIEQDDMFITQPWEASACSELEVDHIDRIYWNTEAKRLEFTAIIWA